MGKMGQYEIKTKHKPSAHFGEIYCIHMKGVTIFVHVFKFQLKIYIWIMGFVL